MRKVLIAITATVLLILTGAAPAHAGTHGEHLQCSNPSNGYTVAADIDYTPTVVPGHPGHWDVSIDSIAVTTTPNFRMDRFWIDIESSPGTWWAVAHYGGDGNPQNTVTEDFLIPARVVPINNDSQSPAWRMSAWGVGAGNSTYSCNDYGSVF
jgi:hypothetical protein